eukprot:scaffold46177_cov34-Tisochrysis_lutea.AAC.2
MRVSAAAPHPHVHRRAVAALAMAAAVAPWAPVVVGAARGRSWARRESGQLRADLPSRAQGRRSSRSDPGWSVRSRPRM